jgi:Domain of unknown function (DUF4908)
VGTSPAGGNDPQKSMRVRVFFLFMTALLATPALAQPDAGPGVPPGMALRLKAERIGPVEPGFYSVGDAGSFVLEPYGPTHYLLRFTGGKESFVLSVEHSSLGARVLKYDTGATAIRVSVWGGMTLYTEGNPGGLPATRQGDAPNPNILAISAGELQTAFNDETGHLTYVQKVNIKFSADPAVLQADPETRGRAFDALTNAAMGIERFLGTLPGVRSLFARKINSVKVAEGGKPTVTLSGQTLLISFVPGEGHEGHASSLAIQQELTRLFAVQPKDMASK